MATYNVEAIVLRTFDYAEADKIVTLFSRQKGKVRAIAKGVRKPKSRKKGMVVPFMHGHFMLYEGRNLDTIIQGEAATSFLGLRQDLDKYAYGSYLLELADGFITEGAKNEKLYFLLLAVMHMLEGEIDPKLVLRIFEIRAMHYLGYRPELTNCVACGRHAHFSAHPNTFFCSSLGGVICPECSGRADGILSCSHGTLRLLERLLQIDLRKVHVLKVSEKMASELEKILREYIDYRLEKKLKSKDFLDALQKGAEI